MDLVFITLTISHFAMLKFEFRSVIHIHDILILHYVCNLNYKCNGGENISWVAQRSNDLFLFLPNTNHGRNTDAGSSIYVL